MFTSLVVVQPPAAEPVTLADAKQHLRVSHSVDDGLITGLITGARQLIEGWTARALVTQTLRYTMSQDPPSGALPLLPMPLLVLPVILTAPQVMNRPLELPRAPVQSILQVSQTDLDGTVNIVDPTDYVPDLSLDPARIRLNWQTVPRWMQHIQVQFIAGYSNDNPLPSPLVSAIKMAIAFLYENRGDNPELDRPPRAIDWLIAPYRIMFFSG
jgi:gp6-like head-tail connector protein